jgi:hypothetical protein
VLAKSSSLGPILVKEQKRKIIRSFTSKQSQLHATRASKHLLRSLNKKEQGFMLHELQTNAQVSTTRKCEWLSDLASSDTDILCHTNYKGTHKHETQKCLGWPSICKLKEWRKLKSTSHKNQIICCNKVL